ncbi:pseudouridine synthase [Caviibacter abscessus]|uniref:pseudouridine synthase n=1 Tax=Caviibacter abscessus TaxID=1766719 RepID=UPI00082D2812|nr:pseudouridine synthase [Caviibacter abscessus]
MRINKFIALSGFCSRRAADKLIEEKRVWINNKPAQIGDEVSDTDIVKLDGERIRLKNNQYEYYILNKPKRVICSNKDKFGRVTAVSLIKSNKRLFTYGRLDYLTQGLIIISNDGDLYNHSMHPSQKLYKSYIATIDKDITEEHLEAMKHGVVIDGYKTAPAKVKRLGKNEVRVAIFEGKNRQVRKMFEVLGYTVKTLKRVKIGELVLGTLEVGKYRALTPEEIKYLKSL